MGVRELKAVSLLELIIFIGNLFCSKLIQESMRLNINLPDNFFAKKTAGLTDVPCVCKVMINGDFYLTFSEPIFEASGFINEFDNRDINARFPVFGGGSVAQHCNAMIQLQDRGKDQYDVLSLKFFDNSEGWVVLIERGMFVPIDENKYEGY
ncbi:hypothetical protein [Comamonas sediminis]|uniref:Uncharacterized protein n=1 Tax=Comamonas sediminis TaxID=1783360 RepID=A0ABV4B4X1_9BURK